jgi:hypothetical protein
MANVRFAAVLTAVICLLFAFNALFLSQNDFTFTKGWDFSGFHSAGSSEEARAGGDEYLLGVGKADITGYVCDGELNAT